MVPDVLAAQPDVDLGLVDIEGGNSHRRRGCHKEISRLLPGPLPRGVAGLGMEGGELGESLTFKPTRSGNWALGTEPTSTLPAVAHSPFARMRNCQASPMPMSMPQKEAVMRATADQAAGAGGWAQRSRRRDKQRPGNGGPTRTPAR